MIERWIIRATLWARNPPSAKRVILVLVVIGFCIALYAVEQFFGWPDWLKAERLGRRGF